MNDDMLLAALASALAPKPAVPSPREIALLHAAIAASASAGSPARVRPRRRLVRPIPMLAAVVLAAGTGTAAAASLGAALPAPLRIGATAVGLPIDDLQVAHARSTMAALRAALGTRNRVEVNADAGRLRGLTERMSAGDRARVEPASDELLARATTLLTTEHGGPEAPSSARETSTTEPAESEPEGSTTEPSSHLETQDHGSGAPETPEKGAASLSGPTTTEATDASGGEPTSEGPTPTMTTNAPASSGEGTPGTSSDEPQARAGSSPDQSTPDS